VLLHPDPASALEAVRAATAAADRVLVFGSFVTVGAALDWLQRDRPGASKAV
jgi:folylpolyglutamate synthase/dihydropteroate synthase